MPVGAISLGLFIVTLAFDKEMTRFDLEEGQRLELARTAGKLGVSVSRRTRQAQWQKPCALTNSTRAIQAGSTEFGQMPAGSCSGQN